MGGAGDSPAPIGDPPTGTTVGILPWPRRPNGRRPTFPFCRAPYCEIFGGMVLRPELAIGCVLVFAGASFFFALAESALFSLRKWRAQQLAENSPERGRKVLELLNDPQALLATTVLGNTFANAGLIATALWLALEGQWPIGWTLAGTLVLVLVGCEVVPKTLAVRAAEQWSLRVVGAMRFMQRATHWPRRLAQQLNSVLLRLIVPKSWQPHAGLTDEEYAELFELAY